MKNYELMVVFVATLEEDEIDKEISKLTSLLEKEKYKVSKIDKWGKRKLAYPIQKQESGFYCVIYFNGGSEIIPEIDRLNKINDKVLRHLVVKSTEPQEQL